LADLAGCQSLLAVISNHDLLNIGHNLSDQPQYFVDQLGQPIVAFKGQQISVKSVDQPISLAQPIVPTQN